MPKTRISQAIDIIKESNIKGDHFGRNAFWVPVTKIGLMRIIGGPCHGYTSRNPSEAIVSSIMKAYNTNPNKHEELDRYYSEIMPYFKSVLLKPYKVGDRHLVVNSHTPGNQSIFCLISSRQPWEAPQTFIDNYIKARETLNPVLSLYFSSIYRYNQVQFATGEHDAISFKATETNLCHWIKTKTFPEGKERVSLSNGNHAGVHFIFEGDTNPQSLSTKIERLANKNQKKTVFGFFKRKINIPTVQPEEVLKLITDSFTPLLTKRKLREG